MALVFNTLLFSCTNDTASDDVLYETHAGDGDEEDEERG